MSDKRVNGPAMVVATSVMKRGPVRIAKISDDLVLPRPVRASVLIASFLGGIVGLALGLPIGGVSGGLYGGIFFGGLGAFLVTWSPLQGESFAKWAELAWGTRRRSHFSLEGQHVRVSVGICPVADPVMGGNAHIRAGAVRIPPSQFDERGVRISEKNQNLDRAEWTPPIVHTSVAPTALATATEPFPTRGALFPEAAGPAPTPDLVSSGDEQAPVRNPWLPTFEPPRPAAPSVQTAPPLTPPYDAADPTSVPGPTPPPQNLPWLGANPAPAPRTED